MPKKNHYAIRIGRKNGVRMASAGIFVGDKCNVNELYCGDLPPWEV